MGGDEPEGQQTRSPIKAAAATLLLLSISVLCASQVLDALLTGQTKFPAKYNDVIVTWTRNPGWFIASIVAWTLMTALVGYVTILGCKHFLRLIRDRSPHRM